MNAWDFRRWGVDFRREETFSSIRDYVVAGDVETVARAAHTAERVTPAVVGNGVLDRLEIGVGDQFTVVVRTALRGTNAMTFRAAAVVDFPVTGLNETVFWAPLERIQRLAHMPEQSGEILVKLTPSAPARTGDGRAGCGGAPDGGPALQRDGDHLRVDSNRVHGLQHYRGGFSSCLPAP